MSTKRRAAGAIRDKIIVTGIAGRLGRLLARRLHPGTDRAEIWLKVHGASLHRFGATWE